MQQRGSCHAESESWPRIIKRGGGESKIYKTVNRGRTVYQVVYWLGGKRTRHTFAAFSDARAHAESQSVAINTQQHAVARMKDTDRDAFVAAERVLRECGTPLLDAVKSYVAATKELKGTGSLIEAARDYAQRHASKISEMTMPEVITSFVANKRATPDLDFRYVQNVDNDCKRISAAFPQRISQLHAQDVQKWIRGLRSKRDGEALGWKRQNDLRSLIVEIAEYARDIHKALPRGDVELASVQPLKKRGTEIGIVTPEEMRILLSTAVNEGKEETLLYYCFGGFAGLRPLDETLSLDWSDVDLARGHIRVRVEAAKTSAKRQIPIADNLRAWLAPYAKKSGRIFTANADERARYLALKSAEFRIPNDGLRHSYGTYRVAICRDLARVSHEMGNSPQVIRTHYDSVRLEDEGKAWFAIAPPETPANVVSMKGARA